MNTSAISAVIITLNAERDLARCLEALRWVDEIVVIDSGSADATAAIAARHGARVLTRPFDHYAAQKNFGIEQARGPWILSIDADEVVTPALRDEIRALLAAPVGVSAFRVHRENIYFGQPVGHVMGCDEPVRLFLKDGGRFEGSVHEKFACEHPGRLNAPLLHFSCADYPEWVRKYRHYVRLDAARQFATGRRFSWRRLLLAPPRVFWLRWIKLEGWKDGWAGFLVAVEMVLGTALLELHLRRLTREAPPA